MRYLDAEKEPVVRVGEITPVGLAVQRDVVLVGNVQELFEVVRLPHEPVRVVGEDVPHLAVADGFEQRVPPRALAVALPRGPVVVHEHQRVRHRKVQALGGVSADPFLTVNTRLVVVIRMRDAAVDRGLLSTPVSGAAAGLSGEG